MRMCICKRDCANDKKLAEAIIAKKFFIRLIKHTIDKTKNGPIFSCQMELSSLT